MVCSALLVAIALGQAAPVLPLEEALREAERANLDLTQARARLDESRAQVGRARAAYLPQIAAGATYTRNSEEAVVPFPTSYVVVTPTTPPAPPPAGSGTPTGQVAVPNAFQDLVVQQRDQLAAQLQISQAILALPAWYALGAARTGTTLAEQTVETARRDVLFGVAQTYYGAVALRKAIAVQERQLAITRDHEKDAKLRFDAGVAPKIAWLRAEIDRARAEQDLTRARNAYASSKVALATLLGRREAAFEVDVPATVAAPEGAALEEEALRERPDVRAAATNVELQRQTRRATAAGYLPTLGAFARAQASNAGGFTGSTTTWAVGLAANWSILDGGLREAELRAGSARIAEADAARAATELRAVSEVRQSRLDLDSAVANRAKAEEQVALARENQRLIEVNFKAGAATYLDVADANQALLAAELGVVNEALNADLAATRLLRAAGRFGR
jgi:outer membrane protein TolC